MSTLNVANISDDQSTLSNGIKSDDVLNDTKEVDTKFVTNGCAKVWSIQAGNGAAGPSLNVTSVEDLGTGSNQVNIANGFTSGSYVVLATAAYAASGIIPMYQSIQTGSFKINNRNGGGTVVSAATRTACFGELA